MASQAEYNKRFDEIIETLGYEPSIARTLTGYLWSAPGQHRVNEHAIDYTLGKLWVVDPKKGSVT